MEKQQRPVFLDIPKLGSKMSIMAKISILHGVLMFLAIPLVLILFHESLTNSQFYQTCYFIASCPLTKLIYLVLIWALMHHMCAGVRFLFLDIHRGIEREMAIKTARWVLVISLLLTIAVGALIW